MNEASALRELKGIGEKTEKLFVKLGVTDIGELLHYYPRRYEMFEEVLPIAESGELEEAAVCASLEKPLGVQRVKHLQIASGMLSDGSGRMRVTWYNMPFLRSTLRPGMRYVFRGRLKKKKQQLVLEQPAVFSLEEYEAKKGKLKPVYPRTEGLTGKTIEKAVRQALDKVTLSREFLPQDIRRRYQLAEYNFALEQIHFPDNMEQMLLARHRLVFDEFYLFLLALRRMKAEGLRARQDFHMQKVTRTDEIIENLDFSLTNAQKKVWKEIERDLTGECLMSRLIQGDVGSGKTILAFLALFLTAENGWQGCLMVPTEVLAVQHFESVKKLIKQQGLLYRVELLTGSMKSKEKLDACRRIADGSADIIIGTHAVFQEKVSYRKLALVITDEQHRFGVRQREALSEKGTMPHVMVMSATPIPRTLAVILYGDLDISVIDELPADRLPIKNCVVDTTYRPKAYRFIESEVRRGHQAYIICPMVEESECLDAEDVISYAERLSSEMPGDIRIGCLHGRMKASEKNQIMEKFLKREIQILVSTTVVEVGVNVQNATVMMVENAERFGLAQLHQLRGRVGRGEAQSYCILCYGKDSEKTRERLEILNRSNDGFFIASEDLKLRGPGDLFGVRQSGELSFAIGDVFQDAQVLVQANEAVQATLQDQNYPNDEKYQILNGILRNYMHKDLYNMNL